MSTKLPNTTDKSIQDLYSENPNLVTIQKAAQALKVSKDTLRRWEAKGKITSIRTTSGYRLYDLKTLSKTIKSKPQSEPVKPHFNPKAPIMLPVTAQTPLVPAKEEHHSFYEFTNLNPEIVKLPSQNKQDSIVPVKKMNDYSGFSRIQKSSATASLKNLTPFKVYSVIALMIVFLSSLLAISSPYIPVINQTQPVKYISELIQKGNKVIKPSQEIALTQSKPEVLAASSIAKEGKFLQLNLDTNVVGNLAVDGEAVFTENITAPNILYSLVAGNNISITGDAQNPTISSTVPLPGDATNTTKGIASFSSTFFTVTDGAVTITDGSITGDQIDDGTVTNTDLANSSITINAGSGLSGGGTVSLGGSITLTATGGGSSVSGVSTITGTANQVIASASTGDITLSLPQSIATTSSPEFANLDLSDLDANGVVFTTGAGLLDTVTTASTGECLLSNGAGAPTWGSCFSGSTSFTLAGDSGPNQSISSGDTLTINGDSNIATLGVDTDHFSITLASVLTGISSIDTIAVSSTALTFAGVGTISSTTTSAITLDSGTTGTVNLGTGNNSKTINLGTGTAGNIINIATDNTVADTLNIASALDTTILNGAIRIAALTTNGPLYTSGGNGTLNSEAQLAVSRGGTGQDFSSTAQGSLPYFSATGTFSALAPSTAGYVLTTQGAGANPTWTDAGSLILRWNTIDDPNGNQTLTMADYTTTWNWATADTETAFSATANALTSGTLFNLSSTSTAGAGSGNSFLLDLSRSGTNSNASHTAYGLRSQVTNTGTTSTNIAGYFSASGATNNYAAIFDAGRVGIGDTTPDSLFDIEGAISGTPSSTGAWLNYTGSTFTDNATSGSGTATTFAANAFGQPTLAATNSNVTTTNAATVYIANAPATGSNQTITAPLALLVDSGNARFDGHVGIGGGFNNIAVSSTSVLGISEAYSGTSSFNHLNIYAAGAPSSSYGANLIGLNINADLHSSATAGITGNLISGYFKTSNSNTTQSVSTAYGLQVATATSAGGAITTNYGLFIDDQTVGTSDYGLRIDAADTQTLWVGGGADGTTASAGIAFGSSRDTNLYRSAADTLKTDDAFNVNGNLNISSAGAITAATGITSSGTITFSGLSADSGVYTTTGGQLTTTPPSSGTLGYWSRTGSTLSPANSGDAITTSGNISTTGTGTISSAGLLSGTAGLTITGATASLNASSNFNTNINTGTSTGAISIGNSSAGAIALSTGSTFGVTTTTGSQTFTSANLTGTTTSSSYVFNASSLTSGTALYITSSATSGKTVDINASQTSGTIFNLAYGSAKTISGDLTGLYVDLNSGNVDATNQNITGVNFKIPTVTDTHTSGTKTLTGMLVNFGSGAGINQNGAGGTLEYVAGDFYMPALTQSAGTLNAYGTRVTTPATITTGGTAYGNYVSATGVGAGTLSGLGVSSITGGAGSEYALNIGSGWDAVLRVGSTTVINGSGVTVEAGGGTGQSTYSTGDILYASGANTLAKRAIGNSNEVLTVVGGVPTWATISGSSCSNCVITDPTSDQTIAPTGQGTTGLIVRQTSTASPTDDIFQITSSDGATKYFYVDKDGNVSTSGTSGQTLTLTPLTDTTALTLVGTNVTSQPLQYVNSKNSSATNGIINMAYGAAQTLTGSVIGIRTDLSTNVTATNQSVTGYQITLPGATNTSGTQAYKGIVISGGSINENGGTATTFTGADITIPALTQTSGTLTAYGANITTPSSITTAGTAYGVNVAATGVGAGSLYGVNVSDISAGAGTEVGMQIGSGWDTNLLFNDTSTRVAVADGGTITILDTAGNSLCTITDNGSVGDLECTGTIGGSGTVGFWSRDAGTGIVSPSNANDVVAISSNKTSTPLLNLTSTGATSNAFTLTGNSITTGNLASLTGTGFTTGEILDITGTWAPSDGSTNEGIDLNFTHAPTSSADVFSAIDLDITDATTLNNTVYGLNTSIALSSNSQRTAYGIYSDLTTSGTSGDVLYGGFFNAQGGSSSQGTAYGIWAQAGVANTVEVIHAEIDSNMDTGLKIGNTGSSLAQASVQGVYADLSGNTSSNSGSSAINRTGFQVSQAAASISSGSNNSTYRGFYQSAASSLTTSSSYSGTVSSYGVDLVLPNITQGAGTINSYGVNVANGTITTEGTQYGVNVTTSSITTAGTQYGLNVSASGVGAGSLYGLNISDITGGAGTETGIQIGSGWDTNLYFNDTTTRVAVADTGTINILDSSGNSLCTITDNANVGDLTCTGNITGGSTGTVGYWSRSGTTLSTSNSGDDVALTSVLSTGAKSSYSLSISQANDVSNNNSVGLLSLSNLDTGSTAAVANISQTANGTALAIDLNTGGSSSKGISFSGGVTGMMIDASTVLTTSGIQTNLAGHTITSGSSLKIGGNASSYGTDFTGSLILVNPTRTLATAGATRSESGNYLKIARSNTVNNGTATLNMTGSVADLSSNCTPSLGACNDSSNILSLTQSYSSATGAVLAINNSGTSASILLPGTNDATSGLQFGSDGNSVNLYRSANDTLKTDDAFNVNGNFNITSAGAISAATGISSSGTINFSGLSASSGVYTDGSKNLTSTPPTSGTIGYWARTGSTLSPANSGDVVLLDNNTAYQMKDTGGVTRSLVSLNSSDMQTFGAGVYDATYNGYRVDITSSLPLGQGNVAAIDIKSLADLNSDDELVQFGDSAGDFMTILGEGNVGIGDSSPTALFTVGASDAFQINSSGNIANIGGAAHTIANSAGALGIDSATTGAINIGTSANAKTITIGNATGATALAFNSGTGSQTFTSQVSTGTTTTSAFVFDATSLTTGTGSYFTSDSITQGKLLQIATTGNTLTSGTLTDIRTTSTALTGSTGTGSLLNLDWSPGSSTTATGDLFALNIGSNGTTTGNLFNILDSSSSIFSVSETSFTTSLPSNFTAPGDISVAYDLQFTNPTASYIKSQAPLAVVAGETFNSSNLTLGTYNQGTIVLQTNNTTTTAVDMTNTTLTTGTGISASFSALTTGSGLSISSSSTGQTTSSLLRVVQSGVTTGYTGNVVSITGSSTTGAANVLSLTGANTTAGAVLNINANTVTTTNGRGLTLTANGLTTGIAASITSSSSSLTSGTLLNVAQTGVTTGQTGATVAISTTATTGTGASALSVTANALNGQGNGLLVSSSTTGALTNGLVRINASAAHTGTAFQVISAGTTGSAMSIAANSLTTGTALNVSSTSAAGLTSGTLLTLSKTGGTSAAFTGDIANMAYSSTYTTNSLTHSGNVLDLSRAITISTAITNTVSGALLTISDSQTTNTNGSATITYSGDTVSITRAATRTTGTLTNTGNLMTLTSSDASHTGNTLSIADSATHASGGSSLLITASSITNGQALAIVGPSSAGVTGSFVNIASDVGSGGIAMGVSPDFSGSAVNGYGISVTASDNTSTNNSNYLINTYIRATNNAAKSIYGIRTDLASSSTTADYIYGASFVPFTTGAISSGIRQTLGSYASPSSTANNSGGTLQLYGHYSNPTYSASADTSGAQTELYGFYATSSLSFTTNGNGSQYGLYVANGTSTTTGTTSKYGIYIASQTGADTNYSIYSAGGNNAFLGRVGVGVAPTNYTLQTEASITADYLASFINSGNTSTSSVMNVRGGNDTTGTFMDFRRNDNTAVGSITFAGGSTTAFNTTSDRRLKTDITDTRYGLTDLLNISVNDYRFISDPSNTPHTGFIAQDLYQIYPEAVTAPVTSDRYWQVDYGKVTPLIVRSIQQLNDKVENALITINPNGQAGSINASKITVSGDITADGIVKAADYSLNASEINRVGVLASLPVDQQNRASVADTLNLLSQAANAQESRIADLQAKEASTAAALADAKVLGEQALTQTSSLQDSVASTSATIANLSSQIEELFASITGDSNPSEASPSDQLLNQSTNQLALTPPTVMFASDSATLDTLVVNSQATVSGQLTAYEGVFQNSLKSLGDTFLGKTNIAGDLSVDGTFSVTEGSKINALPILYFQTSALAEAVDFFNGLVTITKDGAIAAKDIVTEQISVKADTSAGQVVLPAGETEIPVLNHLVESDSIIILTSETTGAPTLAVSDKVESTGFVVKLGVAHTTDIKFSYLIVGQK